MCTFASESQFGSDGSIIREHKKTDGRARANSKRVGFKEWHNC